MKNKLYIIGVALTLLLCSCGADEQKPLTMDGIAESVITESQNTEETAGSVEDYEKYVGTWQLDGEKTEENLKKYTSLQEMFGTGLASYGAAVEIGADNKFSYYIGIGVGGEGEWQWKEDSLTAVVTPYMDNGEKEIILQPAAEGEKTYLTMEFDGETLYWSKNA